MKLLILTFIVTLISCSGNVHRKHIFFRMDTVVEITVSIPRSFNVKPLWRSVDSLLIEYEKRFSVTGVASEVMSLNERVSHALSVSRELGEMLKTGIAWGDSLGGAFDITVLPLKKIWGFCEECNGDEPLPDSSQVRAVTQTVNYKNVRVNDNGDSVFFGSSHTRVDVGGIAKGYALRQLTALFKNRGIGNYLISAGGDVAAFGRKQDNTPWRVGIRHPRSPSELATTIPLASGSIVTSGDYERYRMVDSVRYHHIFDPSTGYSCGENQSVTILADDPVVADILSTGLFCRHAQDILAYVRVREGIECVVVDRNGTIYNSGFF